MSDPCQKTTKRDRSDSLHKHSLVLKAVLYQDAWRKHLWLLMLEKRGSLSQSTCSRPVHHIIANYAMSLITGCKKHPGMSFNVIVQYESCNAIQHDPMKQCLREDLSLSWKQLKDTMHEKTLRKNKWSNIMQSYALVNLGLQQTCANVFVFHTLHYLRKQCVTENNFTV